MKLLLKVILWPFKVLLRVAKWVIFVMGVLSIALLIGIYSDTHHERVKIPVSKVDSDINTIYQKLRKATDQVGKVPPIYMMNNFYSLLVPNAMVDEYGIYMTYRLKWMLKDHPDALALIIGHEIAHSMLHHTKGYNIYVRDSGPSDELMADGYGAFLAAKAGYNVCKGAEFFLIMRQLYGDNLQSSHPPNIFRYMHLQMEPCREK